MPAQRTALGLGTCDVGVGSNGQKSVPCGAPEHPEMHQDVEQRLHFIVKLQRFALWTNVAIKTSV